MALNEPVLTSRGKLKLTLIVSESSPSTGRQFSDTETSEPSIGNPLNPLISCAADSPAKTLASPGKAPDSAENAADSGLSTSKPSTRSGRATSSSKMSPPFVLADWIKCSGRSLRSGTMQNGIVYPHAPLVLLTGGIGSGLWRTPDASIVTGGAANAEDRKRQGHAIGLHDQVNTPSMWPTPQARVQTDTPSERRRHTPCLESAVKMWPTPNARDYFPAHTPEYIAAKRAQGHGMSMLNDAIGGSLNPQWVEWLMGYPIGWTDLGGSATPSSRKSRK